ncbi:hypothetical protein D3C73_113450 [compost metagenome]
MSKSNMTRTTNGMAAQKSSFNANVDLFAKIGSARGLDLSAQFRKAYNEDADLAVRQLLWVRDIRGGAGERQTFRSLMNQVVRETDINVAARIVAKIPEVGRWDDLWELIGLSETLDFIITEIVAQALLDGNGLCAKWMPREGKKHYKFFLKQFELTERNYRKMIVKLSKTVEQMMCAKQWNQIDFSKLPSVASKNYQRAFKRNAPEAYQEWIDGLATGKTKVNAGAIFPYDVLRGLNSGVQGVADAQWKALPDYLADSKENLLGIVDVSGSMSSYYASKGLTCMDVAVSLGMYVAERSKGIFKDQFITFHNNPTWVDLSDCKTLFERVRKTMGAPWGGSTNLEATFKLILSAAVKHKVPVADMPTKIILWSDMQFNAVDRGFQNNSAFEMIDRMYEAAGYKRPDIIFWNMNSAFGNLPVSFGVGGTAMVTGFSPAIMKSILAQTEVPEVTPLSMMLDTLQVPRYDWQ